MSDITARFHGGNPESKAANASVDGAKAKMREAVAHEYRIAGENGLTSDEVQAKLEGTHQGISPRVTELKTDGILVDSGKRRKTRSGRTAAVLVHVAFATAAVPKGSRRKDKLVKAIAKAALASARDSLGLFDDDEP